MSINPFLRIGSLCTRPNWRYDLLRNPAKYQLQDYVSIPTCSTGSLKRFVGQGFQYEVKYVIPENIRNYVAELDDDKAKLFFSLWDRAFKKNGSKKIIVTPNTSILKANPIWNMKRIDNIPDPFVRRLIYHYSNFIYDSAIAYALKIAHSPEHQEIFRFIGYCIYAKISDNEIAKRWRITPKQVEAIRLLHFDFSRFPVDKMACFAHLRQLTNIGLFSEVDFAYYHRVHELGELGLKAQTNYYSLNDEEKLKVKKYLGESVIANTLGLNLSIRTSEDAVRYNNSVGVVANFWIKEKEVEFTEARIRNLDATTKRIENGLIVEEDSTLSEIDQHFIEMLETLSLQETKIEYKTRDDLEK